MTDREFEDAVRKMRDCQRDYFRSRAWTALRYARDWEEKVDRELTRRTAAREPKQGALL